VQPKTGGVGADFFSNLDGCHVSHAFDIDSHNPLPYINVPKVGGFLEDTRGLYFSTGIFTLATEGQTIRILLALGIC
jgi:hypothetical protein